MREFAAAARSPGKVYFTGGATALLLGFRNQTIDNDLKMDPEPEGAFEAIALLKNRLDLNVEASLDDFIPPATDWRERSRHIAAFGPVQFFHYDWSLQALAKLEHGHVQDLEDVRLFVQKGFLTAKELERRFEEIGPRLLRYPAINAQEFKKKVAEFVRQADEYERR
jgi:hypothetical protein